MLITVSTCTTICTYVPGTTISKCTRFTYIHRAYVHDRLYMHGNQNLRFPPARDLLTYTANSTCTAIHKRDDFYMQDDSFHLHIFYAGRFVSHAQWFSTWTTIPSKCNLMTFDDIHGQRWPTRAWSCTISSIVFYITLCYFSLLITYFVPLKLFLLSFTHLSKSGIGSGLGS